MFSSYVRGMQFWCWVEIETDPFWGMFRDFFRFFFSFFLWKSIILRSKTSERAVKFSEGAFRKTYSEEPIASGSIDDEDDCDRSFSHIFCFLSTKCDHF